MTREQIIRNLKYTMKKYENDNVPTFGTNISLMCKDILDYLEQESVIDKVRTEIKEHADRLNDSLYGDGMRHCIEIIDRYKEESEG